MIYRGDICIGRWRGEIVCLFIKHRMIKLLTHMGCDEIFLFRLSAAALMDILYISRSTAARPTLQTPAPSSPPHPSPKTSLTFPNFLGLSIFLQVLNSPVFCVFQYPKYLNVCFLIKFTSVPDVIPSASDIDWFVWCSYHYFHTAFIVKCIFGFCYVNEE